MISFSYLGGAMISFRSDKAHDLNMSERMLVMTLCSFANKDGECWPTRKELARVTGGSLATIKRLLKALSDKGYIVITHRKTDSGDFTSNFYKLNIEKHEPVTNNNVTSMDAKRKTTTLDKLFDRSWADDSELEKGQI